VEETVKKNEVIEQCRCLRRGKCCEAGTELLITFQRRRMTCPYYPYCPAGDLGRKHNYVSGKNVVGYISLALLALTFFVPPTISLFNYLYVFFFFISSQPENYRLHDSLASWHRFSSFSDGFLGEIDGPVLVLCITDYRCECVSKKGQSWDRVIL
jgi:hypothetical protein